LNLNNKYKSGSNGIQQIIGNEPEFQIDADIDVDGDIVEKKLGEVTDCRQSDWVGYRIRTWVTFPLQ
jgi:hypothetical protein